MGLVNIEDIRHVINSQCSCGGGCPDTGCVWCKIYHVVTEMNTIRSGLNMDPEGATATEVAEEVKRLQNGQRNALATLCGQVNGLRAIIAQADVLLHDEFGGFYESAPENEPLGRVRGMLRNNRKSTELPKFKDNDPSALGHE